MTSANPSSKWSDLAPRVLSAVVMAGIAIAAVALGNPVFLIMISVVIGLCVGEFGRILHPVPPRIFVLLGGLAAIAMFLAGQRFDMTTSSASLIAPTTLLLLLPPLLGAGLIKQHKLLFFGYCSLIMLAGLGFVVMGPEEILIWFLLIIIMSDVAGYFIGRMVGGPKFWPRVSPKKTWSGTIAGWVGALLIGLIAAGFGVFTLAEAMFAPLIAFAGQMGDIAESAIKRKMGIKDSSNLIPGHGGVLDRFDAMIGAAAVLVLLMGVASLMTSAG
ncbi:phosphatidate cytidylyltransferase [Aliiroseovarius sp. Z3]|uniref:phosphatidate cytidylyltransferase n=1 Tax=Aliiroseovarius sp. Z3 TaxID=2811402 RepID=UPI0023B26713|nr:phosphatidate cytidylyltransferase [Aliiroseovarius sp. Z3]MDE9449016.1 phosphatidate cytidylyltransferase [Aliiroseovarius sp. Z3]